MNHFGIGNNLTILLLEGLRTAFKISEAQKGCIWLMKREVYKSRLSRELQSKLFYTCNTGQEAIFLKCHLESVM